MANTVVVSCDSTADLSPELIEKYHIQVFHLPIVKDGQALRDGLEITTSDVFEYKRQTGNLIKTSAPNIAECEEYFNTVCDAGDGLIHFDISGEMSSTYANARAAAADRPDTYIIDSRNLSTGIGLLVLRACELRDEGKSAGEIAQEIYALIPRVDTSFVLDTLEYMHKGGRCSSVAALGANLLKLKPCIEVKNGKMDVVKKYRGKLADVLTAYVADRLHHPEDIDTSRIFITHTCQDSSYFELVWQEVLQKLPFKEVLNTTAGCSVSVHCGPNTLGILFIRKSPLQ